MRPKLNMQNLKAPIMKGLLKIRMKDIPIIPSELSNNSHIQTFKTTSISNALITDLEL